MPSLPYVAPLSEMAAMRLIHERAAEDGTYLNSIGAGERGQYRRVDAGARRRQWHTVVCIFRVGVSRVRPENRHGGCARIARAERTRHTRVIPLAQYFPEFGQGLLVRATATKTADDIARYVDNMTRTIGKRFQPAPSAIEPERNS